MTRTEFAAVIGVIEDGIGKKIESNRIEIFFELLGDLDFNIFKMAAKRVLLSHKWATFPSVAELREAAAETQRGALADLSPGEAWSLAWAATAKIDPEMKGDFERATKHLPPLVVKAMTTYGVNELCYGKEPTGVVRAQFTKIYEQLAAREKRASLYPADLKIGILEVGRKMLTGASK